MKCLVPNCERPVETRGLCASCYQAARKKVVRGVFTWKQLEEKGWALPPQHGGRGGGPFMEMINADDLNPRQREIFGLQPKEEINEVHNS
jgi:hypothetical protein